jgi:hypothetical protein
MSDTNVHRVVGNLHVGTSHFFVDTTTNQVGVNTSTPGAALDVQGGDVKVGSGITLANDGTITATGFSGNGSGLTGVNSDSGSWVNGSSSNIHLAVSTDNVGIGVLDPSHKLDVNGDINISSGTLKVGGTPAVFSNWTVHTNGSDIYRSSGNVGIGTNNPQFKLHIGPVDDNHLYLASSNNLYGWIIDTDDEGNGSVPFRITKRSGGVDTEVLTIKNQDGNVGVGTSNPTNKLHISGTENQLVQIQNTSDTARLVLNGSSGTGGDLIFKQAGTTTWGIASIGDSLHFLDDDSTSQKRMTIDGEGVVINSGTLRNPGNPGCRVTMSGAQFTLPSSSHYPIVYNSEYHDTGNDYNTSTGKFTCPVAGKYLCIHMMTTRSGLTRVALSEVKLYHNTTETARQFQDTTQDSACATNIINCAAGDTLYAGIYNANSTNQFNGAAEYGSQFIVEFLG